MSLLASWHCRSPSGSSERRLPSAVGMQLHRINRQSEPERGWRIIVEYPRLNSVRTGLKQRCDVGRRNIFPIGGPRNFHRPVIYSELDTAGSANLYFGKFRRRGNLKFTPESRVEHRNFLRLSVDWYWKNDPIGAVICGEKVYGGVESALPP